MNLLDEMINSYNEESENIDAKMKASMLFSESAYNELSINYKEAELKIMKESGTSDDLIMLYEAASEGFIGRISKSVQKTIAVFKEFVRKFVETITNTYNSVKAKIVMDKLETASKKNPKLKNKKVNVPDVKKEQKAYQEGIDKLQRKLARLKAGKTSKKDIEEIDDIVNNTRNKVLGISFVAVSVGVAIGIIAALSKDNSSTNAKNVKDAMDAVCADFDFKNVDVDTARAIAKTKQSIAVLAKEKLNNAAHGMNKIFRELKGSVASKNLEVKESVDDIFNEDVYDTVLYDEIFGESVVIADDESIEDVAESSDEFEDQILSSLEDEIFGESVEDDEIESMESYIEELEGELFNESDDEDEDDNQSVGYDDFISRLEDEFSSL